VHEYGVAGLRFVFPHNAPIAEAGAVVGFEDACESGFLAIALVVRGIHVEGAAGGGGLGFGPGADFDGLGGLAGGAVGVREGEAALVLRAGNEVEDGPGKAMRDEVFKVFAVAADLFAADSKEREAGAPGGFTDGAEFDGYLGVAVGIAGDQPVETEVVERGVFDVEAARSGGGLGGERSGEEKVEGQGLEDHRCVLLEKHKHASGVEPFGYGIPPPITTLTISQ